MTASVTRNAINTARISRTPVVYPFSFVTVGDTGIVPNPEGGFMHFVQITVQQSGRINGRVFRVLPNRIEADPKYDF